MEKGNEKVINIIIPVKKLFFLIKSLKEERMSLVGDEPKIKLKKYKLKVQYTILNEILQHYGVDRLLVKLCPNKQIEDLVGAIPGDDKDES